MTSDYMLADSIISAVRWLEVATDPFFVPVERALTRGAIAVAPEMVWQATAEKELLTSAHALRLPMMRPIHVVALTLAYIVMIVGGRRWMAKREKFAMRTFSLFHNAFLVALSAYMCGEIILQAYRAGYSLFANGADETAAGWPMAKILWIFYASKPVEFIDTLIMVLKKNSRQISFLHVYHHCTIFMIWWVVILVAPNGESYFSAMLNSFIHVVMYLYYLLSALGFGSYLTYVKPFITLGQMTQFTLNVVQAVYDIYIGTVVRPGDPGNYPVGIAVLLLVYMVTLLILFGNFFRQDRKRREATLRMKTAKAE